MAVLLSDETISALRAPPPPAPDVTPRPQLGQFGAGEGLHGAPYDPGFGDTGQADAGYTPGQQDVFTPPLNTSGMALPDFGPSMYGSNVRPVQAQPDPLGQAATYGDVGALARGAFSNEAGAVGTTLGLAAPVMQSLAAAIPGESDLPWYLRGPAEAVTTPANWLGAGELGALRGGLGLAGAGLASAGVGQVDQGLPAPLRTAAEFGAGALGFGAGVGLGGLATRGFGSRVFPAPERPFPTDVSRETSAAPESRPVQPGGMSEAAITPDEINYEIHQLRERMRANNEAAGELWMSGQASGEKDLFNAAAQSPDHPAIQPQSMDAAANPIRGMAEEYRARNAASDAMELRLAKLEDQYQRALMKQPGGIPGEPGAAALPPQRPLYRNPADYPLAPELGIRQGNVQRFAAALPPPDEGMVRLYRGEGSGANTGRRAGGFGVEGQPFYTSDPVRAALFGDVMYIDMPNEVAAAAKVPGSGRDYSLPPQYRLQSQPVIPAAALPDAAASGGIPEAVAPGEAAAEPFPEISPDEARRVQAELLQQQREQHYGGQAATGLRQAGEIAPGALRDPAYTQTPEEVVAGNRAALERSGGGVGVNGEVVPNSTALIDPTAPSYDPHSVLLQRLQDLQPLQEQQAANVSANQSRQMGALQGTLANTKLTGEARWYAAMSQMRGAAEKVQFQPLAEVLTPEAGQAYFDDIADAVTSGQIKGGTGLAARSGMQKLMTGTDVPTPSESRALEEVFPGITAAIGDNKALSGGGGNNLLSSIGKNPIEALNNTDRSIATALDVVSPVRLGFTAGTVHPAEYERAVADLGRVMISPKPTEALNAIWAGYDANPEMAARSVTVDAMFDRDLGGMHGAGYDPFSGEHVPGGGVGVLAKIGDVGPVSEVGQRTQVLSMLNQIGKPAFMQADLSLGLADGSIPADFTLNVNDPNYVRNVKIFHDLGQREDLLFGHASFRPLGDATGTVMRFGNWFAAQGELYTRAILGTAQGGLNLIPGMDISVSPATAASRQVMSRLLPLWAMVATGLGLAQGIKLDDPRRFKNWIPQIVINPTNGRGPHVPGFAPDTQWAPPILNYLGNAIGVGRGAYEGATGGSRFGGTAPTTGLERVTGAATGAAGELGYWMRTQESKAVSLLHDLASGSTLGGVSPSVKNELPVPFFAQPALSDNPRSPGVNIAGMITGGGFHEPSPAQALDYALTADPRYGKGFSQLERGQQHDIQQDPQYKDLTGAVAAKSATQASPSAIRLHESQAFTQGAQKSLASAGQFMDKGVDANGQPFTGKNWRERYHSLNDALRNQKDGVYANAGTKPGTDPVLDSYYKALSDATDVTQRLDGGALEQWHAQNDGKPLDGGKPGDTWGAYVDRNTGLTFKGDPHYDQYKADVKRIADSGYWTIGDKDAVDYAKHLNLPGVTNAATLDYALSQQAHERGVPANRIPLLVRGEMGGYSQRVSRDHMVALENNPALVPLLQHWGYSVPTRATLMQGQAALDAAMPQ